MFTVEIPFHQYSILGCKLYRHSIPNVNTLGGENGYHLGNELSLFR